MPLIQRAPVDQKILEPGIGAPFLEHLSNLLVVVRQELAGKVQHERLAEIELLLARYLDVFVGVVDVIRQFLLLVIIERFGMPIELARLLAQEGLMVVARAAADEVEGQHQIGPADRHRRSAGRKAFEPG